MAARGRYYLRGQAITKTVAGRILGSCYRMPQTAATNQFETLARNYFRCNPMATYYADAATGIAYTRA